MGEEGRQKGESKRESEKRREVESEGKRVRKL